MSKSAVTRWEHQNTPDGTKQIGYDKDGNKVYEEFLAADGSKIARQFRPGGGLLQRQEYDPQGTLRTLEMFDDSGKVFIYEIFHENGAKTCSQESGPDDQQRLRYWLPSGQLVSDENFKDRMKDGTCFYYSAKTGNLVTSEEWRQGQEHGVFKEFYDHPTGTQLKKIETYREGVPEGLFAEYFPNGQVRRQTSYLSGKKEGTSLKFDDKGTMLERLQFSDDELHGLQEHFDSQGRLRKTEQFKKGKLHGLTCLFNELGQLESRRSFVEGVWEQEKEASIQGVGDETVVLHGSNGKVKSIRNYKDGRPHGEFQTFHSNEQLHEKGSYDHGKKAGSFQEFSDEGVLIKECQWVDDQQEGICKYFYLSGEIQREATLKKGKLLHERQFLKNGKIQFECFLETPEKMKRKYFDENGNLRWEEDLVWRPSREWILNGLQKGYFSDGKLAEIRSYENGQLHGAQKNYDREGKIEREGLFKDGVLVEVIIYDQGEPKTAIKYKSDGSIDSKINVTPDRSGQNH